MFFKKILLNDEKGGVQTDLFHEITGLIIMSIDRGKMCQMVVSDMCQSVPGLEAAMIVDEEGLPIATVFLEDILDENINESLVGAMTAKALVGTSEVVKKLGKGSLEVMTVKTSQGVIFIKQIICTQQNHYTNVFIVVLADSVIPTNLAMLHIEKAARQIADII